jgi:hypothetical protein
MLLMLERNATQLKHLIVSCAAKLSSESPPVVGRQQYALVIRVRERHFTDQNNVDK